MNKLARIGIFFFATIASVTATGCGGSEPEPQAPPQPTYGAPQQYPQQQYPQQQYPQQQYPQQQYPQQQYPQQTPQAATSAPLAQPAPIAFPCQSDAQCVAHRCNVAAGKCAWPCQTNADCQPGFQCLAPQCVPALAPPAQ